MAELLFVPFKKSSDVDLVKPLKNLIQSTYSSSESHEDYSDALNELSRLRTSAIWKVFEKSSLDVIYSYYDQLVSLESKVPPQDVQIPFKWKDAFDKGSIFGGRMSLTVSSLAFERVCVLFNAGAAQSAAAAQEPLDTEDSLKLAAKLLQQAAGTFSWLKANVLMAVHQEPTPDLAPDTLDALARLMLAQAQEVIAYKCIRDEMTDGMVAKVCAAAEELYAEALRALGKDPQRALWDRDWIPTVTAKQQAMRGLAQLYQSSGCRAAGAVGEEVARLAAAAEALRGAAARLPRAARLAELAGRAARRLAAAARDNDFIYHERVPDAAALDPVPRATIAKPLPPPHNYTHGKDADEVPAIVSNDQLMETYMPSRKRPRFSYSPSHHQDHVEIEMLGFTPTSTTESDSATPVQLPVPTDLFASLVPLGVHSALQASGARRAELVSAEIGRLREGTQLLNGVLASLNLPAGLEDADAGAGGALPRSIRDKAAAVRAAGGAPALQRLMAELPELLQRNRDILNEADRMLREEAEADASLREQFGARWTRTESAKLTEGFRANGDKYRQIIDNAVRADNIVRDKYHLHKQNIELLSGGEEGVSAGVPAGAGGAAAGAGGAGAANELRALMREVEALKAERDAIEAELKDTTVDMRERFLAALAEAGAIDEPALSAAALGAALAPLQRRVAASLADQEAVLARIQEAHGRLAAARGGDSGRDAALGALAAAHDAFQELTANLTEGTKFYNDLTQLLVAYQSKVEDFCFARKTEKEELMKDLTQEASRPAPRAAPSPPTHHTAAAEEPAAVKREAPPRPAPPAGAGGAGASLPYPVQPAGMPLPYGAPAAPYPVYAPMPALYNPYATLPYPHHARMPPPQQYAPYQHPPAPQHYPAAPPPGYNPYQHQQ